LARGDAHRRRKERRVKWSVFPAGRLCSLRRALLLWLVPLFLAVGSAAAALSYWSYAQMVDAFMDDQMQQLAATIAANPGVHPAPQSVERVHRWGAYVVQVYGPDGRLRATSSAHVELGLVAQEGFHDAAAGGLRWRVYTVPAAAAAPDRVQVLQSAAFRDRLAAERAGAAVAPVLLLLPLSLFILWALARAMSLALREIACQAAQQDEHHIAELSVRGVPQEIVPMVLSFNSLLRRLREAFATQRRFVQDAAHELRTPITAIALQLENMHQDVQCEAAAGRYGQLHAGVRRAQRLVEQLLRLSRQEAAGADGPAMVDLQAQLRESMNTLIGLADQRSIDLGFVGPPAAARPLTLHCVAGDLRSLLDNLIENALRYTPQGGVVDVRLLQEQGRIAVEVVDTGPGIPQDLLPRVFDRFFRVPGTSAEGSGLGLAIARGAAQRCGLALTLRNRGDRSGLVARIEALA
jgi:signal transduction histidine kinase